MLTKIDMLRGFIESRDGSLTVVDKVHQILQMIHSGNKDGFREFSDIHTVIDMLHSYIQQVVAGDNDEVIGKDD